MEHYRVVFEFDCPAGHPTKLDQLVSGTDRTTIMRDISGRHYTCSVCKCDLPPPVKGTFKFSQPGD